jgi:hypothetical protein
MKENETKKTSLCGKCLLSRILQLLASLFFVGIFFSLPSCVEENEYDLSSISLDSVRFVTAVEAPIAKVHFTMEDLFRHRASKGEFQKLNEKYNLSQFLDTDKLPLPAYLKFNSNIEAVDSLEDVTFKDNVGEGNVIDSICEAALTLTVENKFPFDGEVEVRFYELEELENYSVLKEHSSLTRSFYVRRAVLNDANKVVGAGVSDGTVVLDGEDAQQLQNVTLIKVFYKFNSHSKEEVYIDADYFVDVHLSAYLKARVAVVE